MTRKQLSGSTRNRIYISRQIAATGVDLPEPLFDRLVDLVASVPGRRGNPHQHIALKAVVDLITRKHDVTESDALALKKTFEEGAIFLKRKSWLYQNKDRIAARIYAAGGDTLHPFVVDYLADLVATAPFGKTVPNPHNTLWVLEKTLRALRAASISDVYVVSSMPSAVPRDYPAQLYVGSAQIPTQSYAVFQDAVRRAIEHELHPPLRTFCGGAEA